MYRIGVVMPVLNAFEDAIKALVRIKTQYIWTPYVIPQYKTTWPLAKAWNIGASEAFEDGCTYALIINDDAFVYPQTVDILVSVMKLMKYELVSGVEHFGDTATHFSCFMVGNKIFDRVGYFDENFKPIYFEDNDFVRRMDLLGYKHTGIAHALFDHGGSKSLQIKRDRGEGAKHDEEFRANQALYEKKWGGLPGKETFRYPFNDPTMSITTWQQPEGEWSIQ
jgi:hypothetical protein